VDQERADLCQRLAQRQKQKAELERRYHAAQRQYREEIAPLKEEVLRLRVERRRQAAQRHMRSARHRNAYHAAQRAYESFREHRPSPRPPSGSPKSLYRRASKHCHPDAVPDAYQDEAVATFRALKAAYQAGHGRAVQAIAEALEEWGFPRAPEHDEGEGRPRSPRALRRAIRDLEDSIQSIRGTDAYQDLEAAGTLDALLRAQKQELIEQVRTLRREGRRA
jgi:hypothetical protein